MAAANERCELLKTEILSRERQITAQLVASLAELDARRLYLAEGCASLFTYCVQVLRLSEHAAYGRIEAARAARRFSDGGEASTENIQLRCRAHNACEAAKHFGDVEVRESTRSLWSGRLGPDPSRQRVRS